MNYPVFLSHPTPFLKEQQEFIDALEVYLESNGLLPRTLGITDYSMDSPLTAIRAMLFESNGLISIGFRRSYIKSGIDRPKSTLGLASTDLSGKWITSPWCHIESAMAFQIGLPILIFREEGVYADGILERGVVGMYMPEFSLKDSSCIRPYFRSQEFQQIMQQWQRDVLMVVKNKGLPPKLY